jgi:hypothetical protein
MQMRQKRHVHFTLLFRVLKWKNIHLGFFCLVITEFAICTREIVVQFLQSRIFNVNNNVNLLLPYETLLFLCEFALQALRVTREMLKVAP